MLFYLILTTNIILFLVAGILDIITNEISLSDDNKIKDLISRHKSFDWIIFFSAIFREVMVIWLFMFEMKNFELSSHDFVKKILGCDVEKICSLNFQMQTAATKNKIWLIIFTQSTLNINDLINLNKFPRQ